MGYEQIRNVKKKPKNKYNDESKNNKISEKSQKKEKL